MKAFDFIYDDVQLSSLGFQICHFDSLGVETVSMGSEISFNTVSTQHGEKHELTSSSFEDCLSATIQICKNPCDNSSMYVDLETQRDIMRWLNRNGYHKFKLIDNDGEYSGIYFEASFNVSKIEINGNVVGFELEMFTNRPHALSEPVTVRFDVEANDILNIYNKSDLEGHIFPNIKITVKEAGNLKITNLTEKREMIINSCSENETITIDYPLISSDVPEHKIQNDFNWIFFRLVSTFKNRMNEITSSLPCTIELTYSPIIKVGI